MTVRKIPDVAGYCPMGCGELLVLGEDGHITCSYIDCPEPSAVDILLGQVHIDAHLLKVTGGIWSLQHPLKERLPDNHLFDCPIPETFLRTFSEAAEYGMYRVRLRAGDTIDVEKIPDA